MQGKGHRMLRIHHLLLLLIIGGSTAAGGIFLDVEAWQLHLLIVAAGATWCAGIIMWAACHPRPRKGAGRAQPKAEPDDPPLLKLASPFDRRTLWDFLWLSLARTRYYRVFCGSAVFFTFSLVVFTVSMSGLMEDGAATCLPVAALILLIPGMTLWMQKAAMLQNGWGDKMPVTYECYQDRIVSYGKGVTVFQYSMVFYGFETRRGYYLFVQPGMQGGIKQNSQVLVFSKNGLSVSEGVQMRALLAEKLGSCFYCFCSKGMTEEKR